MTEREALIQLATPEPDWPVGTPEWQEWRDRTTEALGLARTLAVRSELSPSFTVAVFLDGDDSPATAAGDVEVALKAAVAAMESSGLIRGGAVTLRV